MLVPSCHKCTISGLSFEKISINDLIWTVIHGFNPGPSGIRESELEQFVWKFEDGSIE